MFLRAVDATEVVVAGVLLVSVYPVPQEAVTLPSLTAPILPPDVLALLARLVDADVVVVVVAVVSLEVLVAREVVVVVWEVAWLCELV